MAAKTSEQLKIEWFESALSRINRECTKGFSPETVIKSILEISSNALSRKDEAIRL